MQEAEDDKSSTRSTLQRDKWDNKTEFILSCVGYAVGLGNLYRFPYLCMRNGGGAFLIPYFVCLFLCGIPLFCMELVIGQFSASGPIQVWNMCPLFRGLGYGSVIITSFLCSIWNILFAYIIYYLFKSCTKELPWADCNNDWNTASCLKKRDIVIYNTSFTNGTHYNASITFENVSSIIPSAGKSPAQEFWEYKVLQLSPGIEDLGGVRWELLLCCVVGWCIIFLCVFKGAKSIGKVAYVTATLPYLLLTVILVRGLTLPGAMDGVKYYIIPDWSKLLEFKVWAEGCLQVFFTLGAAWGTLITMASYNKFNNNCVRDAMVVPVINCLTSMYGGFVIFSVIGFMAHQLGKPIEEIGASGPALIFIAYPEAIVHMPISPLWAILFFVMLLSVGIDSQFTMFETMVGSIIDSYPKYLRRHKLKFIAVVCLLEILIGIILCTKAGFYIFVLVEWYLGCFTLILIALLECLVVSWIYGLDRLYSDIELMLGHRPGIWWKICWGFLSPTILLVISMYSFAALEKPSFNGYEYPLWAIGIGWIVASCSFWPIPFCIIKGLLMQNGTLKERLKSAIQPLPQWGPSEGKEFYTLTAQSNKEGCFSLLKYCGATTYEECQQNEKQIPLQEKV